METREKTRAVPHSIEAEKGVLGSLLLARGDTGRIFETLRAEHFHSRRHQVIYEAICVLSDQHGGVDPILLRDLLEREGTLEEIGGLDCLLELTEAVQTSANAEHYAQIVRDRAQLRRLIDTCGGIVEDAYLSHNAAAEQVDLAEQRIFEIAEHRSSVEVIPIRDAMQSTFDLIDSWQKGNTGLHTGYDDLDHKTNGLHPSELAVIAGRPSMGKTTLALNIARHVAVESRVPVAIFSLEVDRRQLAMNLLCGEARVSTQKLRSADLSGREWEDIGAAAGVLSESPIFVDDSVGLNTMSIRAKARRLKARHDLGLVIVDYLQMLELGGRRPDDSRQQEISAISRALKNIARELEIPVITVSQLSRAVEQRESHRPRMSDLRESGAIEQDADLILLLYREEYYNPDKAEAKGKADVIIAKQRNGPTGSVELTFLGEWLRFENAARYEEEF